MQAALPPAGRGPGRAVGQFSLSPEARDPGVDGVTPSPRAGEEGMRDEEGKRADSSSSTLCSVRALDALDDVPPRQGGPSTLQSPLIPMPVSSEHAQM